MVVPSQNISNDYHEDKEKISGKPPAFDGENFDYWKDRIESVFLAHDADLWDMVIDGYTHPVDRRGQKIDKKWCLTSKNVISETILKPEQYSSVLSHTQNMRKSQTES